MRAAVPAGLLALTACAANPAERRPEPMAGAATRPVHAASAGLPAEVWQRYATTADRSRLRGWREAFTTGLSAARAAEQGRDIDAEGALMWPDAGEADLALPPGDYRCRVTKLGVRGGGSGLPYVAYPYFRCRIGPGEGVRSFEKLTGSQRQVGALYPGRAGRLVFLGTMVLGTEAAAYRYGTDAERDVAGMLERVGERRWRLLMPYPRFESVMDVMEIVPE